MVFICLFFSDAGCFFFVRLRFVSLDCSLHIFPSVLSNVYVGICVFNATF